MKFVFRPDVVLCGGLGSKHQLTMLYGSVRGLCLVMFTRNDELTCCDNFTEKKYNQGVIKAYCLHYDKKTKSPMKSASFKQHLNCLSIHLLFVRNISFENVRVTCLKKKKSSDILTLCALCLC